MDPTPRRLSRRSFLAATALGGAAVASGGAVSIVEAHRRGHGGSDEDQPWFEASVSELQRLMRHGRLTSVELTAAYLNRIKTLNPQLHAVIETNGDAIDTAARRDRERRHGRVRGPLHGIPVLLKDNIATRDGEQTTAGSFALVGSRVPRDAALAARLRDAGAVVLGKANLSEWANFRGFVPTAEAGLFLNGWSGARRVHARPVRAGLEPVGLIVGIGRRPRPRT